ncbi:MAG: hypothetical protein ACLFQE_07060 [Thermotogota bacterium]
MKYKYENGLPVANLGWVVIESVNHLVKNGFVVCDPSLNHKAWNVTDKQSICPECAKHIEVKQLELFQND